MNKHTGSAALVLIAAMAPLPAWAALFDLSDVKVTANASSSTQLAPQKDDAAVASAPYGSPDRTEAEALVLAETMAVPFPNVPTSQTRAFASSAVDTFGVFGVGVSGFFFRSSLPPNALVARGSYTRSITNNSTTTLPVVVDFTIPAPTIRFFGVGNSFPAGQDPAKDAKAYVQAKMLTKVTHPDGSVVENVVLDYGIDVHRQPNIASLFPIPSRDAEGLSRFDEPDGSFGFRLSELHEENLPVGDIGPGDILEFIYTYAAEASTGFGETGIFAAIGDPFDLKVGGGSFDLRVDVPDGAGGAMKGNAGTMGAGGSPNVGGTGSAGTSGSGGTTGAAGATGAGGAPGAGGASGTAGVSGSAAGVSGSDPVGGSSGARNPGAAPDEHGTQSGGCDCSVSASTALDPGMASVLAVAMLMLCRRRARRP